MSNTILVVEDEKPIRTLINFNLVEAGFSTVLEGNAEEAIKKISECLPTLAIVDWMLPQMSGIDLVKRLKKENRTKHIPLILLTAKSDEKDRLRGLELGVDDYLTKPFSPKELIARVKNILRRTAPHKTGEISHMGNFKLNPVTRRIEAPDGFVGLGPTEFKLLHFLVTHPGRVYSRKQLLDFVWGDHVFIEERTVDVHIRRLRKALTKINFSDQIQTSRGLGYLFTDNFAKKKRI